MKKRHFIIVGFATSILSIIFGSAILFQLNSKKNDNIVQLSKMKKSLDERLTLQRLAYTKFDLAEINFGVSHLLPEKGKSNYRFGVQKMLEESDTFLFCAAYGLSEDFANRIINFLNISRHDEDTEFSDLEDQKFTEGKQPKLDKLIDLLKLTSAIQYYDEIDNFSELSYQRESLKEEIIFLFYTNLDTHNKAISAIKSKNEKINFWFSFSTYLSICLQIVGLIIIFLKDLGSD